MKQFLVLLLTCTFSCFAGTSISDQESYLRPVREAVSSDAFFSRFKQDTGYIEILEHVGLQQGRHYLTKLKERHESVYASLKLFKKNDQLGGPLCFDYPKIGKISGTTIRYAYMLGDIERAFGSLRGKKIVEIGGGYGGQCLVISILRDFRSYTLFDLPDVNRLIDKYLAAHNVKRVKTRLLGEIPESENYDVLISNFAFSECKKAIQDRYFEEVISKTKMGYMVINFVGYDTGGYSADEIYKRLGEMGFECHVIDNEDETHTCIFHRPAFAIQNHILPMKHT